MTVSLRRSIMSDGRISRGVHCVTAERGRHSANFLRAVGSPACYTGAHSEPHGDIGRSVRRFVQAEPQELRPFGWSFGYFSASSAGTTFFVRCATRWRSRRRAESALDDDGHVSHFAGSHSSIRLVVRTVLALSVVARGVPLLHHEPAGVVPIDDESPVHGMGRPRILCLAVGIQFVRGVGVLEFHGRSVYAGPGARLFGVIAAGGSTGALFGPLITTGLTYVFPVPILMLASALF